MDELTEGFYWIRRKGAHFTSEVGWYQVSERRKAWYVAGKEGSISQDAVTVLSGPLDMPVTRINPKPKLDEQGGQLFTIDIHVYDFKAANQKSACEIAYRMVKASFLTNITSVSARPVLDTKEKFDGSIEASEISGEPVARRIPFASYVPSFNRPDPQNRVPSVLDFDILAQEQMGETAYNARYQTGLIHAIFKLVVIIAKTVAKRDRP